eukprot:11778083-Prorocentrum_lima.AAC.1
MTSSLVGSEMCIRDSNGDVEVFWETLTDDLRAEPAGSVCFSVKDAPKAVSYTHLTLPTICSV